MNRNSIATPYIALGVFLFCWISLPKTFSCQIRSSTIAAFSPIWKKSEQSEEERLQLENQNLKNQLEMIYEWALSESRFKEENPSFASKKASQLKSRLQDQLLYFPAQVIYRDPTSWSSSLWINAGEEDNQAIGRNLIAKNSPVVSGSSLVGVIDYVGRKQSRIRLITDSGVSPSVRAVRGGTQNKELGQLLHATLNRLAARGELFKNSEEKEECISLLRRLELKTGVGDEIHLAKGELCGSSAPFWRSRCQILKGIGFNYDYSDEEGAARDLRTGSLAKGTGTAMPILKEGDLLVTSGLDGVFPFGLLVANVTQVHPLKEGAYSYEIEAKPCASNLSDLQTVFILPPLNSE